MSHYGTARIPGTFWSYPPDERAHLPTHGRRSAWSASSIEEFVREGVYWKSDGPVPKGAFGVRCYPDPNGKNGVRWVARHVVRWEVDSNNRLICVWGESPWDEAVEEALELLDLHMPEEV